MQERGIISNTGCTNSKTVEIASKQQNMGQGEGAGSVQTWNGSQANRTGSAA